VKAGWSPRLRLASYYRIHSVEEAKAAIFATGPIVVGSTWFEEWFEPDSLGRLPQGRTDVGGHAFVLYGWSDPLACFRAANSWGNRWGDHGDFWIPFDVWGSALDEAWKAVDALDLPRDPR
jgi:hypothetical protein